MRYPPLEVVLTWPEPNYVNPENRGPALLIVNLTILPLALLCLALRLWVRVRMLKRFWWDDWLMIAATICCCGVTVAAIVASQLYGWNLHVWDLRPKEMLQGRQVSIACQTIFLFASGFGKLSILVSYLRIALVGSWFRRLAWASIALVAATIPAFLVLLWLQCRPASSYWNLFLVTRDCIPEGPPLMANTIITVLTDFIVYVLPMPIFWQLKLPLMQRISLMVVFGFGSVVVVAGCLRTYWIHYVEFETYDVTWEGFYLWIWGTVEVNLGVICGCAPVLKPLVWPSEYSTRSRSRGGYKHTSAATDDSRQWGGKKRRTPISTLVLESDEGFVPLDDLDSRIKASHSRPLGLPLQDELPRPPRSAFQPAQYNAMLFANNGDPEPGLAPAAIRKY
ncbi:Uu.00g120610.m01.CDS01 [Anthostomella pinea]|uniref:Uu.00g120610.m01.CDS01 n=1 Tax=Anthostomella pinea TaxID=933095 RepID=A0AAI8YHD2_9PEZI|nr:Uu.00g120610.m01.CDS01 [Anthostomella pinea]